MGTGNRSVVWVVDDVESVRKSLVAVLETAQITVRDYSSARLFLDEFEPDTAGCLLIDHHMPDMTGLELLQLLQARTGIPPAILITGQGDGILQEKALKAGAIAMLNKPVDGDELIAMIEHLVA